MTAPAPEVGRTGIDSARVRGRCSSTAGSLDNPFRTLQTLPGVAGTDEFGSKLSVRGGAPDQNLTMMDGVEIHNPYRLFGLTSAFNPETVGRFELMAGGFGAKYGDRLSSVVVVENRDGGRRPAFQRVVVGEHHGRQHHRRRTAARTGAGVVARHRAPDVLRSRGGAVRRSGSAVVQRRPDSRPPGNFPAAGACRCSACAAVKITSIKPDDEADGRAEIRSRNDLVTATLVSPLARASSTSIVAWSRNTDLIDVRDDQTRFSVDANLVDEGWGVTIKEEPVGGLPHLVTFGVRFRFP